MKVLWLFCTRWSLALLFVQALTTRTAPVVVAFRATFQPVDRRGALIRTSRFSSAPFSPQQGALPPRRPDSWNIVWQLRASSGSSSSSSSTAEGWQIDVDMPPSGSDRTAQMVIRPILSVPSDLVLVRYKVPFGLNVSPRRGLAVCTQDGPGGEKVGDILRFTSHWKLDLPSGNGLAASAATVAGGISWQCNMFDVMKANNWEQVVEALTSNVSSRTDEVVLIFERSRQWPPPELM